MEGEELEPQDVKLAHILQEDAQRQRDNALENDSHSKSPHPSASAEVSQAGASPAPNNSAESPSHRDLEMKTKNPRQSTGSMPSDVEITGEQATLAAIGQQQVSRETPALEPPSAQAVSSGRALPSRVITEETIDRAYAEFILYCNPNIPADVDTFELCRTFRSPPRCEGRGFAMFKLWELIQRLDRKEVKFWSQLAHELLAVDPSDSRRQGISTKVHQYGGRLKRWMGLTHIDAFFEYCLGHPHPYYENIPSPQAPIPENRDGLHCTQDLALQSLNPEFSSKRGRKRVEYTDDERDPRKRSRIESREPRGRQSSGQGIRWTSPQTKRRPPNGYVSYPYGVPGTPGQLPPYVPPQSPATPSQAPVTPGQPSMAAGNPPGHTPGQPPIQTPRRPIGTPLSAPPSTLSANSHGGSTSGSNIPTAALPGSQPPIPALPAAAHTPVLMYHPPNEAPRTGPAAPPVSLAPAPMPPVPREADLIHRVVQVFARQLEHANPRLRDSIEAHAVAVGAVKKLSPNLPNFPSSAIAMYCAGCLGVGPQLGFGGSLRRQVTVSLYNDNGGAQSENGSIGGNGSQNGAGAGSGLPALPPPVLPPRPNDTNRDRNRMEVAYEFQPSLDLTIRSVTEIDSVNNLVPGKQGGGSGGSAVNSDGNGGSDNEGDENAETWKARYMALRREMRRKEDQVKELKKRVVDVVMEAP